MLFSQKCLVLAVLPLGTLGSPKHSHHSHISANPKQAHVPVNLSHVHVYGWSPPYINKYPGVRAGFDLWDNMPQEPSYHFPALPLQAEVRNVYAGLSPESIKNETWSQLPKLLQQAMIARYMEMDGAGRMAVGLADSRILTNDTALRPNADRSARHLMTRAVSLACHFIDDFGIDHAVPAALSSWMRHQELASPLLLFNEGRNLSLAIQQALANQTQMVEHGSSNHIQQQGVRGKNPISRKPTNPSPLLTHNQTLSNATGHKFAAEEHVEKRTAQDINSGGSWNHRYGSKNTTAADTTWFGGSHTSSDYEGSDSAQALEKRQDPRGPPLRDTPYMPRTKLRFKKSLRRLRSEMDSISRSITEMELLEREARGVTDGRLATPYDELGRRERFALRLTDHWCEAVEVCKFAKDKLYRFFNKKPGERIDFKNDRPLPEYSEYELEGMTEPSVIPPDYEQSQMRGWARERVVHDDHWRTMGYDGAMDDMPLGNPAPRPVRLPEVEDPFRRSLTTLWETKSLAWVEQDTYIVMWEWRRPFRWRNTRARPKFPENGCWPSCNHGRYQMTRKERNDFIRKWREDLPDTPVGPEDPIKEPGNDPFRGPTTHGNNEFDPEVPEEGPDVAGSSAVEGMNEIGDTAEHAVENIGRSLGEELSSQVSEQLGVRITQGLTNWFSRFFGSTEEAIAKLGGRIMANAAGEMIVAAGEVTADGIVSLMGLLSPLLIVVDIAMLPTMFVDAIAETAHYDYGTCRRSTNLCYGWDGATANCQRRYPCKTDGAKCAYRRVRPEKVVCNWDEYNAWITATGIGPTDAAGKGFIAHIQEKAFIFARNKADQLQAKYDACLLSSGGKKCNHINAELKKWRIREARHARKMDYMRSPKAAKQAKRAWEKAEVLSKQYFEAHHLLVHRRTITEGCNWGKGCNSTFKAEAVKLQQEAQDKNDVLRFKLLSTMKKARALTMKADPIGMTNKVMRTMSAPVNNTAVLNMTEHGYHSRDWGYRPRNITVDLTHAMENGTWTLGIPVRD